VVDTAVVVDRDEYTISTDPGRLDLVAMHRFLATS